MFTCSLCRFETELDDVVLRSLVKGTIVCLQCYERITGNTHPMPKKLRLEITSLLAGASTT